MIPQGPCHIKARLLQERAQSVRSGLIVRVIPTHSPPQDSGRCPEVDGAFAGLSVHSLPQKSLILGFLSDKSSRDASLLTSDYNLPKDHFQSENKASDSMETAF